MKHRASWHRLGKRLSLVCALACMTLAGVAHAAEQHGQVTFNGLPVPGAIVTASLAANGQGAQKFTAVSDQQGNYSFPDLPNGAWKIQVEMSFFSTLEQTITIAPASAGMNPGIRWELKMLPLDQVLARTKVIPAETKPALNAAAAPAKPEAAKAKAGAPDAPHPPDESQQSNDGFLVNGSVNNASTSQFTIAPGFGNTRKGVTSLYTGGLAVILDNSALDARPYALGGSNTPKSNYNLFTAVATFGGPIRIPRLLPRGPNFFVAYQWTRNDSAYTLSGLVPTLAQRAITPMPVTPADGLIAQQLLALYPLPNLAGNANYNYQTGVLTGSDQDAMQLHLDKAIGHRDEFYGGFSFQSRRSDNASLFHFHDTTDTLGLYGTVSWQHRLNRGLFATLGYTFSRYRTLVHPYFADRTNFGGDAGIEGADPSPTDWGPPTLSFSNGISTLYDSQSAFNRNRTEAVSPSIASYRGRHNITAGFDFRRQEFNYLTQPNPRGSFTFTGAVSGVSDFVDFIQGTPDTSAIAYGNADKYLRQSVYDAYATDDWRIKPELTLNVGVRWEYGAPITELKDRLVNLDAANGFTAVAPVLASDPVGSLTGQHYPTSLLRPDRADVEPRIGVSWRPIPGSSLVIRAGYGIYADTSVYQTTALQMATQSPLSNTLSAQYSAGCPLSLTTGLMRQSCTETTANTFAVDPNFRVGYAQTWQVALQRDLPAALQVTATYLGVEGGHGVQEFLPNTYAIGAANPCPSCPSGFVYRASNGGSNRQAGSLQLRRRLRSGFTASALYTYSKSIDDDSVLGGQGSAASGATSQDYSSGSIAQNWRDLHAERGLSTFDQRHVLTSSIQYTSGMGMSGGTLLTGWRGHVLKEWTVSGTIGAGSGLPETPVYFAAASGSGYTGNLRPDRASGSAGTALAGHFLNANTYAIPTAGTFGDAGRDSITGPSTFTFNASLSRTFRIEKRYNLDIRVEAANLLNRGVFTSYNNTLSPAACVIDPAITCPGTPPTPPTLSESSPLFGLPASANSMRSLQTTARLRF
jgi:hypothetical protein